MPRDHIAPLKEKAHRIAQDNCTRVMARNAEHEIAKALVAAEESGYRRALNAPVDDLQSRVRHWVVTRIGLDAMHPQERALRLLEEAIELAQAVGVDHEMVTRQAAHVFNRPSGCPEQEAGGVAVCLLAVCAALGKPMVEIARAEVERIEAKPLDAIRGSLARKADADLVTTAPRSCPECGYTTDDSARWMDHHLCKGKIPAIRQEDEDEERIA